MHRFRCLALRCLASSVTPRRRFRINVAHNQLFLSQRDPLIGNPRCLHIARGTIRRIAYREGSGWGRFALYTFLTALEGYRLSST
jgi:hypothetical protein